MGSHVAKEEGGPGNGEEIFVLWRVVWSLEHVQHALGDEEATKDVDGGDECGGSSQCGRGRGGQVASAHAQETTDGSDARDGLVTDMRGECSEGVTPHTVW